MPNSTHAHLPIRGGPLAQIIDHVPIHTFVQLHGVAGFVLHKSHKHPGQWVVSHIKTGAECGTGATQKSAIQDAVIKSGDESNVYSGIARTKEQLAMLGVQI